MPFLIISSWQNEKYYTVELAIRDCFKSQNTFWSGWFQDRRPSLLGATFLLLGPRLPFSPPFYSILSDFPNRALSHKPLQTMLHLQEQLQAAWRHGGAPKVVFVVVAVQLLSRVWVFVAPWAADARLPCPSLSPWFCSNICPSSQWCHPTISFSVNPFSSCRQSFSASGSFPVSWLFASRGQSTEAAASAPVVPKNIQDRSPLRLAISISLQSKGLSRVFSSTTVLKHKFFSVHLSLWSKPHIYTWLLENT